MEKNGINEYADKTYEQVSGWINNCDSKASILLALIGVFLPIALTSDFLLEGINAELKNIVGLFSGNCSCRAWGSVLLILLLGISVFYFIKALRFLFLVFFARLDGRRKEENPSVSFYKSIGELSYEEYKQLVSDISADKLTDDKLRQVHDCSKICTQKFLNYNKAIRTTKLALAFFGAYIAFFLIINCL
jgi:hypothetical protein